MVQVVYTDNDGFNMLAYGAGAQKHPGTLQFLENSINAISNVSQTLTDAGRSFFSNVGDMYERFNGAEAIRLAKAAVRRVSSIFQPDAISYIQDIGRMQNAPLAMQRWLMAEPTVRTLYHQQRCDGYSETYVDMEPGRVGADHYDWRRVNQGMVKHDEANPEEWSYTTYMDDLHEGDRELTLEEKVDVLSTWDLIRYHIQKGEEDPTSPFAGML